MTQTQSPLDSEPYFTFVSGMIRDGDTNATIVRQVEEKHGLVTTKDSIRRFRIRHDLNPGAFEEQKEYTRINGDNAEACIFVEVNQAPNADPTVLPVLPDPDAMLRQRGLDPEDWYIDNIQCNEWHGLRKGGNNRIKLYQTKFNCKRRRPELALVPVRSDGWQPPPRPRIRAARHSADPTLVVIFGDYQAPFYDKRLHELSLRWLEHNRPARGVDLGDLMDLPTAGRHKPDPQNVARVNECTQEGYNIQRGRLEASPHTLWDWLLGNHDIRLYDYIAQNAPEVSGLTRVSTSGDSGEDVHALAHIMRSDELGITIHEPHGSYEDAQVNLSPNLAVRHGWIARQGGGRSALETLKATGFSILVGHTHRQSIVQHTVYEIDGAPRQLLGAEIGCMCRIDKRGELDEKGRRYPNYTTLPDWQQGFATAAIYPDGKFKVDLASYVNGALLWRNQRFE